MVQEVVQFIAMAWLGADFVLRNKMFRHLGRVDTMSWPQGNDDIHDQSTRTREDCIRVFVDLNKVTGTWTVWRMSKAEQSSASRVIGWVGVRLLATRQPLSDNFHPPSSLRKHRNNISVRYRANNMCGSDIFLGFLAILFPPIAGE